ncbi:hypothetical protein [uncultured Jannaschia sp.]|uniref:hypothetical protein n=1 Tax=uncultured Jannaschia sp. TaxID=293347 RepID=UPI0026325454|nr:hypothetical protein [uncultured Jannaschia sp.]
MGTGTMGARMVTDAKPTRDDRLKSALKANMARRKAQKRGRAAAEAAEDDSPAPAGDDGQETDANG